MSKKLSTHEVIDRTRATAVDLSSVRFVLRYLLECGATPKGIFGEIRDLLDEADSRMSEMVLLDEDRDLLVYGLVARACERLDTTTDERALFESLKSADQVVLRWKRT